MAETEKRRVYSDLSEGTTVTFETWSPGSGRQEYKGEIVEVDEDHPMCAFTKYKVKHSSGWAWVAANKITELGN